MISCSPREIQKAYKILKSIASKFVEDRDTENALKYIDQCISLVQQFNWIYADEELEMLEKRIGELLLPEMPVDYQVEQERVVFFDDFCLTYVLTIQYLEALVKAGKKVLYVTSRYRYNNDTKRFFSHIEKLNGVEIVKVHNRSISHTIADVYEQIISFHPSKILLHIYANSKVIPALYVLPKQITKYLINLADQTFWLGARVIDYCIEFRPFGATVSLECRGLKENQLLMLPFYPIKDENPFAGFPKEVEGRLIVFSGGDIYKTLDSKRTYWKLIKMILDTYPEVVFLFAAKVIDQRGKDWINGFIKENQFEERFLYIGFRPDIYEVLKHCDIYMGTSPASGSLMSQLAATNAKPILQYYYPGTSDDETEQALCVNDVFQISYQNVDGFLQEAGRLIEDSDYRKRQGERLRNAMMQKDQFDDALCRTIESNETQFIIEKKAVDYKHLERRWYELEKCGFCNLLPYLYGVLGPSNCIRHVPSLFVKKQMMVLKNKLHISS
jgi:hypothetical protein